MKRIILMLSFTIGILSYGYSQTCNGSLTVTIDGSDTNLQISATEVHSDLSCNSSSGAPDGTIDITPAGGTAPYTFDWDDIAGTDNDQNRTDLTAGSYTVTVVDANDCETVVGPIVLTEPTAVAVTESITQPSCNAASGAANGEIDITASGGTEAGAYDYNWETLDGSGLVQTDEDQTGLSAGTYNVTITDDNDCTVTASYTLTEPDAVSCTATSPTVGNGGTNILCNGGTGTINVSGADGSGVFEYSMDGTNFQTSGEFTNVAAGTYTITVRDDAGCESTCDVTLTEPDALIAGSCNYVQDLCQLGTGEIKIEASGGVAPYSVSWSATPVAPNTIAGDLDQSSPQSIATDGGSITFTGADGNNQYSFIVTDANGCQIP